jgi:hypothetical protein
VIDVVVAVQTASAAPIVLERLQPQLVIVEHSGEGFVFAAIGL